MSLWEYFSAVEGYVKANAPEKDTSLSDKEKAALWDWL